MDYKVTVEPQGEVYRNVQIAVPRAEYNKRFDAALSRAIPKVNLKGFRPGKAPKSMVAKLYGPELHDEVMSGIARTALTSTIEEHKLEVVGTPEVRFGEDKGEGEELQITASLSLLPKPEIKDFEGLKFDVQLQAVTEEEIEKRINSIRERHAKFTPIEDRTVAQAGDFAFVEYTSTVNGVPLGNKEKHENYCELGAGMLIKELDEALHGASVGVPVKVTIPLSADYTNPEFAGKDALYTAVIKKLELKSLPVLDDAFASETGLASDVVGLRAKVKEDLGKEIEEANLHAKEKKLFETLIEKNAFELPHVLIDEEIRNMLFEMNALDRQSRKSYQMDVSPFRQHFGAQAEYRVRSLLILDRIIETENLTYSDEDWDSWLNGLVTKAGFSSREELEKRFNLEQNGPQLRVVMNREKTTERLLAKADITELPWESANTK